LTEIYNEKFAERLTCPLLENQNVRVDDDRRTRVELKFCAPDQIDRGVEYCAWSYPEEYHENVLIGARFEALFGVGVDSNGNDIDFLPFHAQRQQNDQVCISYQYQTRFRPRCQSFCMNVGEETNVIFGDNAAIKFRISDANIEKEDAVQFTKVEVQVILRDKNGNAMISNDDEQNDEENEDIYDDDDDDACMHVHGDIDRSCPKMYLGKPTIMVHQGLMVALFIVGLVFLCFICSKFPGNSDNNEQSSSRKDGYAKVSTDLELTEVEVPSKATEVKDNKPAKIEKV
jgi:hypothetical protein